MSKLSHFYCIGNHFMVDLFQRRKNSAYLF